MSTVVIVAILGVATAIAWGISDFFAAKSAKSVGPLLASVVVWIEVLFMFVVVSILFLHPQTSLTWIGFGYAVASGISMSLGAAAFFVGLEAGPVSIVCPLSSMYPLTTTLLGLLIFHAHLRYGEIVGVLLIVAGIMVASGFLTTQRPKRKITKGPALALVSALMWGIAFALLAQALKRLTWQTASLIEFTFVTGTLLALMPFIKGDEVISTETIARGFKSKFLLAASVTLLLGEVVFNVGISKSTASGGAAITAISACYPILTIILALKHFKEDVRIVSLLGAFVGIAGVVILSLQ